MIKHLSMAALLASMATAAAATPVDLTGWIENGHNGDLGAGSWAVSSGTDSVTQGINGEPTVFFQPGIECARHINKRHNQLERYR